MTSLRIVWLMLILAPLILAMDLVWLGVVMKDFYVREIGDLMRRSGTGLAPRWGAALGVYVFIPAGLVLFVRPLLGESATLWHALGWGAAFGLVLYGVYDLTNLAVLDKWTVRVTCADIAWGCLLCAASSGVMRLVDGWLPR